VIIMSLLMCIPIPGTNTFPAMVIFLIGVGLSEDDGLLAIAACLVGTVAVMIYAAMIYILVVYGWEGLQQAKDFIKQMLGLE
ncbi:MAG: exopolysaccharide biosynthesis protein, partial [Verrucomicrobiota bacterium]